MVSWLKMAFDSPHFSSTKIVSMWHLTNYAIQYALPFVFGQIIGKPTYKYN
jgi:hypothetical protein